jgi:RNA polymerase sigma-70 factor (ECF subfamily)
MPVKRSSASRNIADLAEERPADPDQDVLELADAEDFKGAAQRLMERYGAAVYRYCRVELRDPVVADDVHQQVFIGAFRDLPRFRRRSSVRIWLFAIARHRVLDAAKKCRRERRSVDEDSAVELPDPCPLAGEALDHARLCEALAASVAELPEDTRTAVLLRYQQGFTFEEMAVICRRKPGTLRARVARALALLRARIDARLDCSS